jgi:pimeloyl-ACP methyl ester carboxylesterase
MRPAIVSTVIALAANAIAAPTASAAPATASLPSSTLGNLQAYTKGFRNVTIRTSAGGHALCVGGTLDVTASAKSLKVDFPENANRTVVTGLFVQSFATNSTIEEDVVTGQGLVSGTWSIYSQLCFPLSTGTINATSVQFLTHGLGADHTYWDNAPGYSYVDYAAQLGHTTFIYDRVGSGRSDAPDPANVVQANLHVEIGHQLIQLLRTGGLAGQTFQNVVAVGHSFGSFMTNALSIRYPKDADALVLTGYSKSFSGMPIAFAGGDLISASEADPLRFANLPAGYVSSATIRGTEFAFFRAPYFDPAILNLAERTKGPISFGEYLTTNTLQGVAANFTGPIDVVCGEHDLPGCQGNCYLPHNWISALKDELYPNASNGSDWYIQPGAGHFFNYHYGTDKSWAHIQNFIARNGF